MGNIKDYGIIRRVDYFEDNEEKGYTVVQYLLLSLYEGLEEDEELDGDEVVMELLEFSISSENNSVVQEKLDIEFVEPEEEEIHPFSEMEDLFESDVKEYGVDLKTIINIKEIKDKCLKYIEEN